MIIWVMWIKFLIPIYLLSNIEITISMTDLDLIVFIPEIIYLEQNMEYIL